MASSLPELASQIKIFYDQQGEASEVLLNYELFLEILSYLPEEIQADFWAEEAQIKEQAAGQVNADGRYETFSSMEDLLDFLDAHQILPVSFKGKVH